MTAPLRILYYYGDLVERADLVRAAGERSQTIEKIASVDALCGIVDGDGRGGAVVETGPENPVHESLIRAVCRRRRAFPILVVGGRGDVAAAVQWMRSGAWTFLERPCPDATLWNEVCAALAAEDAAYAADAARRRVEIEMARLTPDERLVLDRVLVGATNKQIASELDVSLRTVELRRGQIRRKLDVRTVAELVQKVVRQR